MTMKKNRSHIEVDLPTEPTAISHDLWSYSGLIHGEKKIGKTTLLAQAAKGEVFFLEFDPPQKAVAIMQRHMPDWATFEAYLKKLESLAERDSFPRYAVGVIDGADIAYNHCFKWCCESLAISHPNDQNDYGKSWDYIRQRFDWAMRRFMSLPWASWFLCHSRWREVEGRGGRKFDKLVPNLKSQAEEVLVGYVDIWGAYLYDGDRRVLIVDGDESTGAGHRVDGHFRTAGGDRVREIPMGRSAKEGFGRLIRAFDNKQETSNGMKPKAKTKKKSKSR